jgi:hypothetical protein
VAWNEAAFEVLGGSGESAEAHHGLAVLEARIAGRLPAAVREWYLLGGDRSLASISSNMVTQALDLASGTVGRFLDNGYLLLETDSQHCCRWVVTIAPGDDDPPVYLIDPDDDACATRSRYAATFSDYTFTASWDATLWNGEPSTDFDHPLPDGALDALKLRLDVLPSTYGWAMNQGCDAVYRFKVLAEVAVAAMVRTAVWSAIEAPSTSVLEAIATLIGASPQT